MDTLGYQHIQSQDATSDQPIRERLWYWSLTNRIPIHGGLELTERCNFRCIHCFLEGRTESKLLSSAEIYNYVDQITEAGNLWLTLTGGEPLLRKDFSEIYGYAYDNGLLLLVFTNGYFINSDHIDLLTQKVPVTIEMSIYGCSDETFGAVTGQSGAWKRVKSNVEQCVSKDLPVFLKYIALKENFSEIETFRSWVDELGVKFDIAGAIHPGVFGDKNRLSHRILTKDYVYLEMQNPLTYNAWCEILNNAAPRNADSKKIFRCNAGQNIFLISSDGYVHPCVLYRFNSLSLKEKTFKEIWSHMALLHQQPRSKTLQCDRCRYREGCSVCPAWAYLEYGDPESPLQYLCQVVEETIKYFGKEEQNGSEKTIKPENRDYGAKTNRGRGRKAKGSTSERGRELLQEIPTMRSCSENGKKVTFQKTTQLARGDSYQYRRIGPFHLFVDRTPEAHRSMSIFALNDDAMCILNSISTPTTFKGIQQKILHSEKNIAEDQLIGFLTQLYKTGLLEIA